MKLDCLEQSGWIGEGVSIVIHEILQDRVVESGKERRRNVRRSIGSGSSKERRSKLRKSTKKYDRKKGC